MTHPRLTARGLGLRAGDAVLLAGVDLDLLAGEWLGVVGPNGAGKSTLLRLVAGVARGQGTVRVGGAELGRLAARARARLIAYAPQTPTYPPAMSVGEYVLLGRTPYRPLLAGPGAADRAAVRAALARMALTELAERSLGSLSGGERQRAAVARALAQEPRLLVLDEPTSALDLGQAQQALELLDRLRRDDGTAVVTALHDLNLAAQYADRLLLLAGGRAVACGPPGAVLTEAALARHYGAVVDVTPGPDGVRVNPRRPAGS